jgi:hypothetical protein
VGRDLQKAPALMAASDGAQKARRRRRRKPPEETAGQPTVIVDHNWFSKLTG